MLCQKEKDAFASKSTSFKWWLMNQYLQKFLIVTHLLWLRTCRLEFLSGMTQASQHLRIQKGDNRSCTWKSWIYLEAHSHRLLWIASAAIVQIAASRWRTAFLAFAAQVFREQSNLMHSALYHAWKVLTSVAAVSEKCQVLAKHPFLGDLSNLQGQSEFRVFDKAVAVALQRKKSFCILHVNFSGPMLQKFAKIQSHEMRSRCKTLAATS